MAVTIKGDGTVSTGLNADSVDSHEGTTLNDRINVLLNDVSTLNSDVTTLETTGYRFVQRVVYSGNGRIGLSDTFVKANYPWLRAIGVHLIGAGGGGGGCDSLANAQVAVASGGGGGQYTYYFHTDIAGMNASATVTVGAGGYGGPGGGTTGIGGNGYTGGDTTLVVDGTTTYSANGGLGGYDGAARTPPYACSATRGGDASSTAIIRLDGAYSYPGWAYTSSFGVSSAGGRASGPFAGAASMADNNQGMGMEAVGPGGGGAGSLALSAASTSGDSGGNGFSGLVVLDLYA